MTESQHTQCFYLFHSNSQRWAGRKVESGLDAKLSNSSVTLGGREEQGKGKTNLSSLSNPPE